MPQAGVAVAVKSIEVLEHVLATAKPKPFMLAESFCDSQKEGAFYSCCQNRYYCVALVDTRERAGLITVVVISLLYRNAIVVQDQNRTLEGG